jgi:asparagine synthase (glutamine-hydrolysing)
MCGIAGVFTVERPVDADLVSAVLRMADRQVHRGPNDWGILLPDEAARDTTVRAQLEARGWQHVSTYPGSCEPPAAILVSRRLSILDLSDAGRMPMGTPDGRVWVTYNGEIYNFAEIRAELTGRGYAFRSQGDTETLLYGYAEWGPEVVHRLRGMFAFAILDVRQPEDPKLFLARDRFGIKPLYWGRRNCVLQFASEVRALMAGGLMPNEPEPRGFHGFLVYGSVPAPWTTVRDVFSLPAAHALEIDELSYSYPEPRRYWTIPPSASSHLGYVEAAAEVRRLLDESVRSHLVSDVPLGVFLSGGMDSTALAALASKHLDHPLTTLCVTFDEREFAEGEHATATAHRYGTKHIEVRLTSWNFLNEIPQILASMDQPTVDGVNVYFVARAAREAGLTVALSGLGGDEVFWGYPGFRTGPRLARLAALPAIPRLAAFVARGARALGRPRLEKLEFLREHSLLGPYLAVRGLFPPARAARLLGAGRLPLWAADDRDARLNAAEYARLEFGTYLQNQLLRDTDVFGMAHTIEVRVPFLDHRLVELVAALSPDHAHAGAGPKPLLAAALSGAFSDGAATRPKMGFTFPFGPWMRRAWDQIAQQTEHPEPVEQREAEKVSAAFRRGRVHWSRPWSLAVLTGMARQGSLAPWPRDAGPRRVMFLLPQVYGPPGGIQRYNRALLRAVGETLPRTELAVVSVNDEGIPEDASVRGRVHFTGAGPRTRLLHRATFVAKALHGAWRHRPELIVCGHINLMPLVWCFGALFGVRTMLIAHGVEAWSTGGLRRWAARRADRIIPVSRYTATRMSKWGIPDDVISVLSNTVDGDEFRPLWRKTERSGRYLLTVARLERSEGYKGVDRVLEALPAIRKRRPDVRYRIVGTGDDVLRLKALASDLGVAPHVVFDGAVSDEGLLRLYSDSDLLVMLSVGEGFGIVFLEALACGVPTVAGYCAGSVEALLDGRLGQLIKLEESHATASTIVAALDVKCSDIASDRSARRAGVLETYGFDRFRARVEEILGINAPARELMPGPR